jgi:hypothetical protein
MGLVQKRKLMVRRANLVRARLRALKDVAWDQMAPIGREFGSPDFDRLMEEDFQNLAGVFDPNMKKLPGSKAKDAH